MDRNKRFSCEICDKSFKLGKAPLFIMKAHRKTHTNQQSLDCVVKDCTKKIFPKANMTIDKSCNLPIEFFNHLENVHATGFDQYQIKATFTCKLCDKILTIIGFTIRWVKVFNPFLSSFSLNILPYSVHF